VAEALITESKAGQGVVKEMDERMRNSEIE